MTSLQALGIAPVINAAGHLTALGGATLSTAVTRAMVESTDRYYDMGELKAKAGAWIARSCGADDACVTPGAAAGIALMAAAVVAGSDPLRVAALPDAGEPNGIAIQAGHLINFGAPVEQMLRIGGAHPIAVGSVNRVADAEVRAALSSPSTVAILFVKSHHAVQKGMLSLGTVITAAQAAKVPVLVDAAAEEDCRAVIAAGADLVTYSGGKAFAGPTSGFIAGRRDLVAACRAQESGIGRTMKVGREAVAGLVAALGVYEEQDLEGEGRRRDEILRQVVERLGQETAIEVTIEPDEVRPSLRRVGLSMCAGARLTLPELVDALRNGAPPIYVRDHHLAEGRILLDPRTLREDEIEVLARRFHEELEGAPGTVKGA